MSALSIKDAAVGKSVFMGAVSVAFLLSTPKDDADFITAILQQNED